MPFIPHTPDDVEQMLNAIGAKKIDDLFDEIPKELRIESLAGIPDALRNADRSTDVDAGCAGRYAAQLHRRRCL
jgi:glycine cleavage system pyridoxal-binding protein P